MKVLNKLYLTVFNKITVNFIELHFAKLFCWNFGNSRVRDIEKHKSSLELEFNRA